MKSRPDNLNIEDIQKVSLDILKFVTKICDSLNLRYCLMYGTLIGAVRHQGFIPWDDDIDIMMPRPDYERFLEYAFNYPEAFGIYQIFNREVNKNYLYGITRVSDSRYEIIKEDEKNCGMGIFIDIYPYDGLGNEYDKALNLLRKSRRNCNIIVDITRINNSIPKSLNAKGKIVYVLKMAKHKFYGIDHYLKNSFNLKKHNDYDNSKYVGPLMWFFTKPEKVVFEKTLFDNRVKMRFEDDYFYVPAEYHKLLTQEYGDYMQLPPEEKRIYHHQYKAYKKI